MINPAGLSVYVKEVLPTGHFWQICVSANALLLLGGYIIRSWVHKRDDMPMSLNKLSIFNMVAFVRHRYDFLNRGFQNTGETVFRFRLFNVGHVQHTLATLLTRRPDRNPWWRFPVKGADQNSSLPKGLTYTLASTISSVA